MEEQLVTLLSQTQSTEEAPRQRAERQLEDLYSNETFPLTLCSIASQSSVPFPIQQAALLILKNYVLATWSPQLDEFKGQVFASDTAKAQIRDTLLNIATSGTADRRVQNAAAYVVSKIASADFPDIWSSLLPTLLHIIPGASDAQLHGTLKVLAELVDDGFNEDQYFRVARDLVNALYGVASSDARTPSLRALAVSVFRGSFTMLELVLEDHKAEVNAFADEALKAWLPLFLSILKVRLPAAPTPAERKAEGGPQELYKGLVALKLQTVKVLMKIKQVFSSILLPQSPELFTAIWEELSSSLPTYQATYIEDDTPDSRLEDSDGLPYTLDFLILEDLDFMQACIRAPPVKKELERRLAADKSAGQESWTLDVMRLAVSYAQITMEEEGMWSLDVNVFLSEETSVTANYTARAACGDLLIKLGEWMREPTTEALLTFSNRLHSANSTWQVKESSLYILTQVLDDWQNYDYKLSPAVANGFLDLARSAMSDEKNFLRARGYLAAATIIQTSTEEFHQVALPLLEASLRASLEDKSDVVQVAGIRAVQLYLQALPMQLTRPLQHTIITALSQWMSGQDMADLKESDDVMVTYLEALRDSIMLDPGVCLTGEGLNLLFNVASQGADNFQIADLVTEVFELICEHISKLGAEPFAQLCQRTLPSLMGAFDVADLTEENALNNLAAEMLSSLAELSSQRLPAGFVATVMPKLNRQLINSNNDELLKACTTTVRSMLQNDADQVLAWEDDSGKGGLEVVLTIVDRLLGPSVDDNAAAEVGGLAAQVVEQAGAERLGPYLTQLLRAVAIRLSSATHAQLIQSLILVFARLTISNPRDVIDFLLQVQMPHDNSTGLQTVMSKWLDNCVYFAGAGEIRQNVIALAKLYQLHDPHVAQLTVRGDLIVPKSDRIITRSRARDNPDQFTVVSAPLKIIKVLVGELQTAGGSSSGNPGLGLGLDGDAGDADDEDGYGDDEDEWEDEPNAFDLGSAAAKAELMAFAEQDPAAAAGRVTDDETQAFLVRFFQDMAASESPQVQELAAGLTEAEREKVNSIVAAG